VLSLTSSFPLCVPAVFLVFSAFQTLPGCNHLGSLALLLAQPWNWMEFPSTARRWKRVSREAISTAQRPRSANDSSTRWWPVCLCPGTSPQELNRFQIPQDQCAQSIQPLRSRLHPPPSLQDGFGYLTLTSDLTSAEILVDVRFSATLNAILQNPSGPLGFLIIPHHCRAQFSVLASPR
jgi:hypothetical protein